MNIDIPSWDLTDGEQVAISGPSGSGKSTLLNLIAGLALPTSGSLVVCDCEVTRLGEAARDRFRAAHLAYMLQTFNLLQGYTALENVLLGAAFAPVRLTAPAPRRCWNAWAWGRGFGTCRRRRRSASSSASRSRGRW